MPRLAYRPVNVGEYVGKYATPGSLYWPPTLQETTFVASIAMQLVTLVITIVALGQGDSTPEVLTIVLILELVVQVVEFLWYSSVGLGYVCLDWSISTMYRYIDWAFTTPVMLVSIMLFSIWEADRDCTDADNVLSDGSRIAALICIILADWIMLFVGWAYESGRKTITDIIDMVGGLYVGFLPFIGAFTPLFVVVGTSFSVWGLVSVLVTFLTWALYGVVAILGMWETIDEEGKNTAYNLLDIVSKNVVGIVISSVALGGDYGNSTTCTTNATAI